MQGRNMAVKASLVFFFGGLLWGIQVVIFHFNNLLPPAQNVHVFHAEKLSDQHYIIKLLGETVEVKLPCKEEIVFGVKTCMQRIPVVAENIQKVDFQKINQDLRENFFEMRSQGLNIIRCLEKKLMYLYQVFGYNSTPAEESSSLII